MKTASILQRCVTPWTTSLLALVIAAPLVLEFSSTPLSADDEELTRLEFAPGRPRTVTIYPGVGKDKDHGGATRSGRVYWYLPYTLKNVSSDSADFYVSVRATSDKGVHYSDLALVEVEKKVEQIEQKALHSAVDRHSAGSDPEKPLSLYETYDADQTKECVALFNPIDPEADTIKILVHGLVNDIVIEDLGDDRWRSTERILELTYSRKGDEFYTSLDKFEFTGKKWITESKEFQFTADE